MPLRGMGVCRGNEVSAINIWDFWAKRYESLWVQKYSLAPTRRLVIDELKELTAGSVSGRKLSLLDVGCGTGQLLAEVSAGLRGSFDFLTGVDTSSQMLMAAEQKAIPAARFCLGGAEDLPFADSQFDVVSCCHSFPYYRDKLRALAEMRRVLKPGSYLLIVSASENNLYDKFIMRLVKLTTGKASYPSATRMAEMLQAAGCRVAAQKKLKVKFYMPSIILTIAKAEMGL